MAPSMPSLDDAQRVIEQVESYVVVSATTVANELPHLGQHINRLWQDVSRFGPKIPEIHLPSLGDFEVPPPPPPPPPPRTLLEASAEWAEDHPWAAVGIGAGVAVGTTLLVGYGGFAVMGKKQRKHKLSGERKQVVVVLGADVPTGLAVVQELERKGYIVIASCATADAASELEHACKGFVRALVLDPTLPESVPNFVRLLLSALSRRFPINAPGDPHAAPGSQPYVHSVVSLLSLYTPTSPPPAPLERLRLTESYLPYLVATHITPLTALQALLPLLRASPARVRDNARAGRPPSVVMCLPAPDARVGLPFAPARAMAAAASARAIEVLRREIAAAAASGGAPAMRYLNVIALDVGVVDAPAPSRRMLGAPPPTTGEFDEAYGGAYAALVAEHGQEQEIARRRPSSALAFAESVVEVVAHGHRRTISVFGRKMPLGPLARWVFGWRYPVGAGALTYTLAASLPQTVLDALLNLPYLMISARNSLIPAPPSASAPATIASAPKERPLERSVHAPAPGRGSERGHEAEEAGSDADVESNASSGERADIRGSWVSLGSSTTTNPWKAT